MRAVIKFIINVAILVGVIWLLMKYTPVGPRVRDFVSSKTGTQISDVFKGTKNKVATSVTGVLQGASCATPWGSSIPNGATIFAYKSDTPENDGSCKEEVRTCQDGVLLGSYGFATCGNKSESDEGNTGEYIPGRLKATGKSCTTPRGKSVAHGDYMVSYESPSSCRFQRRMCVDGELMGQFKYNYCILPTNDTNIASASLYASDYNSAKNFSNTINGESPYANNAAVYGVDGYYPNTQVSYGGNNANKLSPSDYRNQNNNGNSVVVSSSSTWGGSWDGQKTNPFATQGGSQYQTPRDWKNNYTNYDLTFKGCNTPRGTYVDHGQFVIAYRSANPGLGRSCEYERRSCNYGTLAGSFSYPSCSMGGQSYNQYSNLPGNEGYDKYYWNQPSHNVKPNKSCTTPWGEIVADGDYVKAYRHDTSPWSEGCIGEIRSCNNGVLQGSYSKQKCTLTYQHVQSPVGARCALPRGGSIANGDSITAYENYRASPYQGCIAETRTCNNGFLHGSKTYSSCKVSEPITQPPVIVNKSCVLPRGGTIANGQTVTAYLASEAPLIPGCVKEQRTCVNGTLQGKGYSFGGCIVIPPPTPPTPPMPPLPNFPTLSGTTIPGIPTPPTPPVPDWIPDWLIPKSRR